MLRRIKNAARRRRLARDGIRPEIHCETVHLGSEGAGWTICPSGLDAGSVVYSVGVGAEISFDRALVERLGATVHAFDPTPRSVAWMRTQDLPEALVFHPLGLGAHDGTIAFHPPRKATSAHFTPVRRHRRADDADRVECPVRRLSTLLGELGHDHVDLLKLDIEGGEYDVLEDLLDAGVDVRQMAVEFHHCYRTIPYTRTRDAVHRLQAAGYRVFHVSERTYEISLLRTPVHTGGV